MNSVADYVDHGLALVAIPKGSKGPVTVGWNLPENAITTAEGAARITGNVGLLHLSCSPPTGCIDVDDYAAAKPLLAKADIDIDLLLNAPDAVQISSGRANRAKLLYRLPAHVPTLQTIQIHDPATGEMVLELRCAAANGTTVQDVLPPSTHPDTGQEYAWSGKGHWSNVPTIPDQLVAFWQSQISRPSAPASANVNQPAAAPITLSPETVQHLRSALLHMRSDGRPNWVKAGMALHELGDVGRGLWLEWSVTSEKYDPADASRTWDSFKPTGIGHKYVFAEAQRQGWVNPAQNFVHELTARALPSALKPVPALPTDALPQAIRDAAVDMADRLQCPVDYLVTAMLSAAGTIIGNQIGIYPLAHDESWEVYPCLWGGIVGAPGTKKTPALQAAFKPLTHLEEQAAIAYKAAFKQYKLDLSNYQSLMVTWKSKKAGSMPVAPTEPIPERFMVHDTTYQKLGEILANNPRGLLAQSDELSGLLQSLDTPGQEAARGFFLTGWGGTSGYSFDRIGRGSIVLPRYCLSVFGGFQPDRIKGYVQFAQRGSSKNDGLLQRFQLLVWPEPMATFKIVDRAPDKAAIDAFHAAMLRLPAIAKVPMPNVRPGPHAQRLLHFDSNAQDLFNSWYTGLETFLASGKVDAARQSHFSKYRSLVPALALLFHLLDGHTGPVPLGCVEKAIAFGMYLKAHADRVYASVSGHDYACTRSLAEKLIAGSLKDGFTCRTVVLKGWSGLASKEAVQSALDALVEYGWLIEEETRSGGRPTVGYRINTSISAGLLSVVN